MKRKLKEIVCDVLLNDVAEYFGVEKPLCVVGRLDNPGVFFRLAGRPAIMINEDLARDCIESGDLRPLIQVLTHEISEYKYSRANRIIPGFSHLMAVATEKDLFGKHGSMMRSLLARKYVARRMRDEEIVEEFVSNL